MVKQMLECLLVARDPNLLRVLTSSLGQLGVEASVCPDTEEAREWLQRTKFDSVVVDCVEFEGTGMRLLQEVRHAAPNAKAIVVAIVDEEVSRQARGELGAHFVLERPIQPDLLARSLRAAQSLMLQERRRYFRHKVDLTASLIRENQEVRVTMTNLSAGGMSFSSGKPLAVGWSGQVEFLLPESRTRMEFRGEIVWLDGQQKGGIKFTRLPPRQQQLLEDWLESFDDAPELETSRSKAGV